MIAILLSAIIGSGVFLGIILLVFVVKKISCYHKTNSPPKDELHGIPDDVDINRAYGIGKRESDDSSHLRVTTNNSYNIENDYTYIDYSVHPQECTQEGKLDETLDETKTATNQQFLLCQDGHDGMTTLHDHSRDCRARGQQVAVAEIHHTAKPSNFTPVAPEGGNHTEGDSVVHPLPVLPQRQQENQIQDKGTCADEYIEVYHRTGTLV